MGRFSPKMAHWAEKLAARAFEEKAADDGDLSKLLGTFATAKGKLKFPKIFIPSPVGEIRLTVAGERARFPGSITLFIDGSWAGRIHLDGRLETRDRIEGLAEFLSEFVADPIGKIVATGKASGNCRFCRLPLTDDRSLEAGWGPDCAANWGLNWGNKIREVA
jgi:hypothetical protein